MMINLSFSWVIYANGNTFSGNKKNPIKKEIIEIMDKVFSASGVVTFDIINPNEIGPQTMQVQTELGLSVLTLGEDDGEDYLVRTYTNTSPSEDKITILGERWDDKLVCHNIETVRDLVLEFIISGDVCLLT